jgi:hypothetical protein
MKYLFLISAMAIFSYVLCRNISRDVLLWKQSKATNHNNRFFIRMWSLIPSAVLFTLFKTGWSMLGWYALLCLTISSAMIAFVWANLFDGIRNKCCDQRWLFVGSDGKEDGTIENLLQKRPWVQWVKIGLGILFILIYILS